MWGRKVEETSRELGRDVSVELRKQEKEAGNKDNSAENVDNEEKERRGEGG